MWTSAQTRAQYLAIAKLRWRIFVNGFRRKSGNAVGTIISYIIMAPFLLALLGGLTAGAFTLAMLCVKSGHTPMLALVYSGIFVITLLTNIQVGQPGTTFDPTQLIRFPLTPRSYTFTRLFFGVMSPGNIVVMFMALAAAAGIIVEKPSLWLAALVASATFAAANILFTRMLFSWVDRWLATRRAREIFTAVIFLVGMGFQFWNMHYNVGRHHHHDDDDPAQQAAEDAQMQARMEQYEKLKHYVHVLDVFPSGLAANTVVEAETHKPGMAVAETLGTLAWAAVFFWIFSLRTQTEFRGENLSDVANAVSKRDAKKTGPRPVSPAIASSAIAAPAALPQGDLNRTQPTRDTVAALMSKELLYLRRNTGLFYAFVSPIIMVVIFATMRAAHGMGHTWLFPAALAYSMLGVMPLNFNSFGFDGIGVQTYFLTPVTMRDVLLAKNIFNTLITAVEIIVILVVVTMIAGFPPVAIVVSVILWAVATLMLELTIGNYQSISSPRRIDPGRTAQKQAKPLSALLSMGILIAMVGLGYALLLLSETFTDLAWILPVSMLVFAAIATAIYWHNLKGMDVYAMRHRDSLFEEMSRKA